MRPFFDHLIRRLSNSVTIKAMSLKRILLAAVGLVTVAGGTEGARTSVYLATRDQPEETGGKYFYYGFFRKGIYEKPGTDLVNDEALQEKLWTISEELVGEEFHVS